MLRVSLSLLLLVAALAAGAQTSMNGRDYVPDQKTAIAIAEAVLVARYGQEWVNAQLPLHAIDSEGDYWIVQGHGPGPVTSKGGGPAVWINKHSGCPKIMDRMK